MVGLVWQKQTRVWQKRLGPLLAAQAACSLNNQGLSVREQRLGKRTSESERAKSGSQGEGRKTLGPVTVAARVLGTVGMKYLILLDGILIDEKPTKAEAEAFVRECVELNPRIHPWHYTIKLRLVLPAKA